MYNDNFEQERHTLAYLKNTTDKDQIYALILIRIADQLKRLVDMAESAKLDQDGYQ